MRPLAFVLGALAGSAAMPSRRRTHAALDLEPIALPPVSVPAVAVGAFALGALAIGAVAIGALASAGSKFARRGCARLRSTTSWYGASTSPTRPRRRGDADPEP